MAFLGFLRKFAGTQPVQQSEGSRNAERRATSRRNPRPGTRILVVDDSPTILALLKRMLEPAGITVTTVTTAEDALEVLKSAQFDGVFLDIILPGADGFHALRQIRRDPDLRHLPIIMMSGNEQATEQFYCKRIGADDFVPKPFNRRAVFGSLERLLDAEGGLKRSLRIGGFDRTLAAA